MRYITEYYIKLKLIDGSAPTKKRVVLFRRSTNAVIQTIAAADVPADGIITISGVDSAIPAKDIFAVAFDDDGNRQLAGADKLSVLSKQTWGDKAPVVDIEYTPGSTTNEKVSNTPMIISPKGINQELVNGVLTTFAANVPTITEDGLLVHNYQTNQVEYGSNGFDSFVNMTQTMSSLYGLPLLQLRDTVDNGTHTATINTNTFGSFSTTYDRYMLVSFSARSVGTAYLLRTFNIKNGSTSIASVLFNSDLTINTNVNMLYQFSKPEVKRPGFNRIMLLFRIPANSDVTAITIEHMLFSMGFGYSTYTSATTNGLDITDLFVGLVNNREISVPLPSAPTTAAITFFHSLGSSESNISFNYYYDVAKLPLFSTLIIKSNDDGITPYSIMLDTQVQLRFGSNNGLAATSGPQIQYLCGGFVRIPINIYNSTSDYTSRLCFDCWIDLKTASNVESSLTWDPMDIFRIRAFADAWSEIPSDIKTHYGLTQEKFTPSGVLVLYENLTKGTKQATFDKYRGVSGDLMVMARGANSQLYRGAFSVKYLKIWTKPLPADWVKI